MRAGLWTGLWVLLGIGCADRSEVVRIKALDGDEVIDSVYPTEPGELVFSEDLPVDVAFEIEFSETVSLPSAREAIWLEDQESNPLAVELTARLQDVGVIPVERLAAGQNHTLILAGEITNVEGDTSSIDHRVVFFTAP